MHAPLQHPNPWQSWRSSCRAHVPWVQVVYLIPGHLDSEFYLEWLDERQGWGHFYGHLLTVLRWVNVMAGQRLYNVLCSELVLDSILLQINDVRSGMYELGILLSFSAVPPSWVRGVITASGFFHGDAVFS